MICPNCGCELKDDTKYCTQCGTKIEGKQLNDDVAIGVDVNEEQWSGNNSSTKICPNCNSAVPKHVRVCVNCAYPFYRAEEEGRRRKSVNIRNGFLGAAIVAGIMFVIFLTISSKTINLNKYTSINIYGYDSVGNAEVYIDTDAMIHDYEKRFGEDIYVIINSLDYSLSDYYNLSNGDEISLNWNVDTETINDIYHCKIKCTNMTVKVEDLKELEKFDPFDHVGIIFEGISSEGSADYEIVSDVFEEDDLSFYFQDDCYGCLSNGDKVTLYYDNNPEGQDYFIEQYGKIPSSTKKEYTVEGLGQYVTDLSQVPQNTMDELEEKGECVYSDYVSDTYGDGEVFKGIDCLGEYLLVKQDQDSWDDNNRLYLVYRVNTEDTFDTKVKNFTSYWFIGFDNLIVNPDGTMNIAYDNYFTPDRTCRSYENDDNVFSSYYYYEGYDSLESLEDNVIKYYRDSYKVYTNIGKGSSASSQNAANSNSANSANEKGIIFPNSSDVKISEEQVKALSDDEIQQAINEIFARNGYIFKDQSLLEYYSKYNWYKKNVDADKFSMEEEFNDIEYANVVLLQEERDRRKNS